jgi:hypothetical protein
MTDLKRLGRRGSYRLGRLKAQGLPDTGPPAPFRPSFTRHEHRGLVSVWLLLVCCGALAIWGGAVIGLWFAPFVVGLVTGISNGYWRWRARVLLIWTTLMALAGWGIPLLAWPALHHGFHPLWVTAHVISGYLGLPAHASLGVALTLLIAVVQALVGLWLGAAIVRLRLAR